MIIYTHDKCKEEAEERHNQQVKKIADAALTILGKSKQWIQKKQTKPSNA